VPIFQSAVSDVFRNPDRDVRVCLTDVHFITGAEL
jgi:hypothetical protein